MAEAISFVAVLPPIKSALIASGDGNGGQIKLDIAESEMDAFKALLAWRGELLRVTIELEG